MDFYTKSIRFLSRRRGNNKQKTSFNFQVTEKVLAVGVGGEGLSFNPQESLPTSRTDHVKGNGPCLGSCLRKQSNAALPTKPHAHTNTTLWKSSAVLFQVFVLHSRVVMTDRESMTLSRVRQRSRHIHSTSCLPINRAPKTGTVPKETPPNTGILTSHCNEFGIHYVTYKRKEIYYQITTYLWIFQTF